MSTEARCEVCGLLVHLVGVTVHPCCAQAWARGDAECGGCRAFTARIRAGLA